MRPLWRPKVRIDGTKIPHNPNPTFLGVTYDTQLTFAKQVEGVASTKNEPEDGLTFQPGWGLVGLVQGVSEDCLRSGPAQPGGQLIPGANALALHIQPAETGESPAESGKSDTRNLRSTPGSVVLREAGLEELRERTEIAGMVMYDKWRET